jgi:hypothetical protein
VQMPNFSTAKQTWPIFRCSGRESLMQAPSGSPNSSLESASWSPEELRLLRGRPVAVSA